MVLSVLFPGPPPPQAIEAPAYFADLNLDQTLISVLAGRDEYDLATVFHTPLLDGESVEYRHAVFRDFDANPQLRKDIDQFAEAMRTMRASLQYARSARNLHAMNAWLLDAVTTHLDAVTTLHARLIDTALASTALCGFRAHLAGVVGESSFRELTDHATAVARGLAAISYCVNIKGDRVRVSRYSGEADYGIEVQAIFDRFAHTDIPPRRFVFRPSKSLDHIETQILDLVARLHPDEFDALSHFCRLHAGFVDETVSRFDREIQFYCAVNTFRDYLATLGLWLCYPTLVRDTKELHAVATFDIALADKLFRTGGKVVCNDIDLAGDERIIVVTGPNQGGKTTFARAVGQLYHLAAIGMPVPGTQVRLRLFDRLFTHFEREEDITTLSGKLEDDLLRVHDILTAATGDTVVVMNESFTSTTLRDARRLGAAVLGRMIALDLRCVYVTFVDELAGLSEATVSMVAAVDPGDSATRTYRVLRRPPDGLAYAAALAQKYRLGYQQVKERMTS